jgi:hypothetical protein
MPFIHKDLFVPSPSEPAIPKQRRQKMHSIDLGHISPFLPNIFSYSMQVVYAFNLSNDFPL